MRHIYTKEILQPLIASSFSFAEVLRKLGLRPNGGTQHNVKRNVILFQIDFSHFLGQGRNRGVDHKGGNVKLHWTKVLVNDRRKGRRESAKRLRSAMIASGIPHVCSTCGCNSIWLGNPLTLQIDHRNGDSLDNRPSNVRFLCPNCHSQTDNFCAKNIGK